MRSKRKSVWSKTEYTTKEYKDAACDEAVAGALDEVVVCIYHPFIQEMME